MPYLPLILLVVVLFYQVFLTGIGDEKQTLPNLNITLYLILGTFVVIGIKGVDGLTRLLFIGKIIGFIAVLLMMLPKAKLENLGAIPLDNLLVISQFQFSLPLLASTLLWGASMATLMQIFVKSV